MVLRFCYSRQPAEGKNNNSNSSSPTAPSTPVPSTPVTLLPSTPLPSVPVSSSGPTTPGPSLLSTPGVDTKPAMGVKEEGRPVDRDRPEDQKVCLAFMNHLLSYVIDGKVLIWLKIIQIQNSATMYSACNNLQFFLHLPIPKYVYETNFLSIFKNN